jgi:hypothetical protein
MRERAMQRRALAPFALQPNQPATCCAGDSFCTADDIHLREDTFYVRLHSTLTNKKGMS